MFELMSKKEMDLSLRDSTFEQVGGGGGVGGGEDRWWVEGGWWVGRNEGRGWRVGGEEWEWGREIGGGGGGGGLKGF